MSDPIEICSSVLQCVYDFQTFIAGILAVISAILAGRWVLNASKIPVEAEKLQLSDATERQRKFTCRRLSYEFRRVSRLARQAEGTIEVIIASQKDITDNTRQKTIIDEPTLLDEWESMSLLSDPSLEEVLNVRFLINRHNFDMKRAGGSFGDDNFQKHVLEQAQTLHTKAAAISSKLAGDINNSA